MTNKEPISSLSAFALAQASMGSAFKNEDNKFFKNKYADLTAIQNAVFPVFHAHGFVIMQCCDRGDLGDFVETKFVHISGDEYSSKVYLQYKAGDMQSYGGAITYARRYGLAALSGVPVEDDDGNAATGRVAQKAPLASAPAPAAPVTPIHRGVRLMKFLDGSEVTEEKLRAIGKEAQEVIDLINETDREFGGRIITALENKKLELGVI